MILDQQAQAITRRSLECDQPCIDVTAVAAGGAPPYEFLWQDGVTGPVRRLCALAETTYTVQVRDSSAGLLPPTTAQVTLLPAACGDDAGLPPADSSGCETFPLDQVVYCGNVGTVAHGPQLHASQPYSLRVHANLSAAGRVQINGVDASCTVHEALATIMVPANQPSDMACVTPLGEYVQLLLVPVYGAATELLLANGGALEICPGCP
jgi:hypothetical protein